MSETSKLLVAMAGSQEPSDDLTVYQQAIKLGNTQLAERLKERLDARQQEINENAAELAIILITDAQGLLSAKVDELRELRAEVARKLACIKELDNAVKYGIATNNVLPLAVALGGLDYDTQKFLDANPEAGVVPKNWQLNSVDQPTDIAGEAAANAG